MAKGRAKDQKGAEYSTIKVVLKALKLYSGRKGIFFLCLLTSIITIVVGVIIPLLTSHILLQIADGAMQQVLYTALAVVGINMLNDAIRVAHLYALNEIQYGVLSGLQHALVGELLKLEVSEVDRTGTGKVIERLASDTDKVSTVFMDYVFWLTYLFSNIGILMTVLILSREMFFLSIIIAAACFIVSNERVKKITEVQKILNVSNDERTSMATEITHGIRDIKTLNAGETIARNVGRKIQEAIGHERNIRRIDRRFQFVENITYNLSEFVFLAFGCFLCSKSLLAIPSFIIVYNYLNRIRDLFYGVVRVIECNKKISLSGNRIFEIIDDKTYRKEHSER